MWMAEICHHRKEIVALQKKIVNRRRASCVFRADENMRAVLHLFSPFYHTICAKERYQNILQTFDSGELIDLDAVHFRKIL
jgi:hypothetical protein